MVLNLTISSDAEAKLKTRAAAAGVELGHVCRPTTRNPGRAATVIARDQRQHRGSVLRSGASEDELSDFLEAEKHAMAAERRENPSG